MNRWTMRLMLAALFLMALPIRSPAPLIYTPGEGWSYEPVGSTGSWRRGRAQQQLEVAQDAFDKKDYSLAQRAARRVVSEWPFSDYAPEGQYLVARCYEAQHMDERAFKEYQKVLDKYPRSSNYEDVLKRQYEIAGRFLGGEWFRLWGYIPAFPSMDKTAGMFEKIVKSGPYSDVGPDAQMNIGAAREKQKDYADAVRAYNTAADRYSDRPKIAADALYRAGVAYQKQALTADYDQSTAAKAIDTFRAFNTLYPGDPRGANTDKIVASLQTEQARGNFAIAKYYEKGQKWNGAIVYYNQVLLLDPNPKSAYSTEARIRIDAINRRLHPVTQ
jgi:outer membrane protein assembly factor BamD